MRPRVLALYLALLPAAASAADVPVHGKQLVLRARGVHRSGTILLSDPAIAPPFADPSAGASLVVSGAPGTGQCRVEVALESSAWRPIGRRQAPRGYRYRPRKPTTGVRRVVLKGGTLVVEVGAGWPCDLAAASQPVPVAVALRIPGARYCAAFGGTQVANRQGRLVLREAPAPAACPKTDVTVADLNILHGLSCPPQTAGCRREDRLDLLFQWIARAGCPDVVTLQEVAQAFAPLIDARRTTACPFAYEMAYMTTTIGSDDEVILSRYPIVTQEVVPLYNLNFRSVLHTRIEHPIGPLDVFSTHLASSSDLAQSPCSAPGCPADCVAAGAATVRDCQGVQVRQLVAARHDVPTPAIVTGDLNESPGSFVYGQLTNTGGWVDTYLAAGNPECVPATGVGCTSGRLDDVLDQLESPASNEVERIDYIFVVPPAAGSVCVDGPTDDDGDGTATRLFADEPNAACGTAPAPVCWPSDHEGVQLDLGCG